MYNPIGYYQQKLNLQSASFELIEHEDAMVATVYKVTLISGEQLILKACLRTQDYLRELHFLKHFAGDLPVPRILAVIEPEPNFNGAILMECLPGRILRTSDFTEPLAYEVGTLLARIHLNRTERYGDLTQPNDLGCDPRIPFTHKFEEGIDECQNNLPKELLDNCCNYYSQHVDLLSSVDGPCVIHRDFRPGNLIIDDSKLQGIIDWSSARSGFAEEDFCPFFHTEWSSDFLYIKPILEGYASIRPVPDYQSIMPLLRLSKAIATIGFTVKQGTWNNSAARIYENNRNFLQTFFRAL